MEEGKVVHDEAKEDEQERPAAGVNEELCARGSTRDTGCRGQDGGDTDQKQEGGKYEIGCGEAVPTGVAQLREGRRTHLIVDDDHECDRQAAQHVEREETFRLCQSGFADDVGVDCRGN